MAATNATRERADDPEEWGTEPEEMPEEVLKLLDERRTADEDLSLDEIFGLLKNRRRREVLKYLQRTEDGAAALDELAEYIAAKENDTTVDQLSSDQRKRVYIGLYQCHLPKMDDLGVVDYEQDRGTITLRDTVEQLEPYMSRDDTDEPLPAVELGVSSAVVVVVTAGALGVGPLAAVPSAAWAAVSTVALLAVTLYQLWRYRSEQ